MKTREDVIEFYHQLEKPVRTHQVQNGALDLGTSGTHYGQRQIEIEAFLRQLWAAGSLQSNTPSNDFDCYKKGILAGTDPTSQKYWGTVSDYDQLIVEMAALSVTMIVTKDTFWEKLSKKEQTNLYRWLEQINHIGVHENNWLFFRVLTNVCFLKLGLPADITQMNLDLEKLDSFYVGEGWYIDGNKHQMDYYIAWAFHFYGLLYAAFMEKEDPERSAIFIKRSRLFAQDFKYWFDDEGKAIPFGRSLTYRFAQSAFWSALVFANVEALPWGEIKYLLFKNLSFWQHQKICQPDGLLSIGYSYENLYMSESYNGPGSPYWAFKTFLILACPKTHPFWQAKMLKPEKQQTHFVSKAKMLLRTEPDGISAMYPADQTTNQAHAAEKYSKFVYTSEFGFSISKDNNGIARGAFDNTLAVALAGSNHYLIKEIDEDYKITSFFVWHKWAPFIGVEVRTYLIPVLYGHIRIHEIDSKYTLDILDGGYAVKAWNGHKKDYQYQEDTITSEIQGENGYTKAVNLGNYDTATILFPDPNTNLLYPNSALAMLKGHISEKSQTFISGQFANKNGVPIPIPKIENLPNEYLITDFDNRQLLVPKQK